MKIISYNVNGIRAATNKGLMDWLKAANPDVLCLQEIKALPEQIDHELVKQTGYTGFYHSAEKKGYSGVAILTKRQPDHVEMGCGIDYIDREGRIIRADYGDISIMSVYIPSGTNPLRQGLKMQFLADFQQYINSLKQHRPNLIISGDYNICHKPIDIHDPIRNANSSGFLPEEREWVSGFIDSGFTDTFRYFNNQPDNYSWWSYRANARNNNKGWRIDYHMASTPLAAKLKRAAILPDAKHSDHCPILVELG
jgi:exodeoxyribonuclease-3